MSYLMLQSGMPLPSLCSHYALVDGLRRAPSSYCHLHYHSQSPYRWVANDGQSRLLKFRLVPSDRQLKESGLLSSEDQAEPWETKTKRELRKHVDYLRHEFINRLKDSPVKYVLQIQIWKTEKRIPDDLWDPQKVRNIAVMMLLTMTMVVIMLPMMSAL